MSITPSLVVIRSRKSLIKIPSMLFLSIYIVISYQWVISLVLYTWFRLIVRLILDLRLRRRRSHRMTSVVVNSYQFFSLYGLSWFLAFPYCKGKKRVFFQDEIQAHLNFSPFLLPLANIFRLQSKYALVQELNVIQSKWDSGDLAFRPNLAHYL